MLRFESPQTSWRRVANTDAEVAGVPVPAGTNIFLSLAAANHQPDIFEDPGDFDIHRPNARNHISFGKGIHFCLGARLARLEATVALEVLTERIPSLTAGRGPEPGALRQHHLPRPPGAAVGLGPVTTIAELVQDAAARFGEVSSRSWRSAARPYPTGTGVQHPAARLDGRVSA